MDARLCRTVLTGLLLGLLLLPIGSTTGANIAARPGSNAPERGRAVPVTHEPVLRMRVGTFDPLDKVPPDIQSTDTGVGLRLIQFPGPIQGDWYAALIDAGLEVVFYIPDYTYLVWGTDHQIHRVSDTAPVRWRGDYYPIYALQPELLESLGTAREGAPEAYAIAEVAIQIYHHAGASEVLEQIYAAATGVLRPAMQVQDTLIVGVQVPRALVTGLATLPGVISVESLMTPELLDEVQGQLIAGNVNATGSQPSGPGYLSWLTSTVGLPTLASAYPIVDITDDGIDDGTDVPVHPDFYEAGDLQRPDRLAYNANWTDDISADSAGGHGTLNASIASGYNALAGWRYQDVDGYNYGLGINPFGRVAGSKVFSNAGYWAFPDYGELAAYAYLRGTRILSNSWGESKGTGSYQLDDQIYDGLVRDANAAMPGSQPMTIIFAAGNSGPGSGTIGSPANAKNVITVGASESYRPTWVDGCFIGETGADNANDVISFSSRGPTADGRIKPDLVAPGTHIVGAASQASSYHGRGVCDTYYPTGQTLYAASSGTSHATPAVSGAVSLLTRFYEDTYGAYPSPAMLKAYLINSARYLDGVSTGDTLPSPSQGYGAVNLGMAFDTTPRMVQDQTTLLRDTGDSVVLYGRVARTDRPFRVTLAWTDAPGSSVGAPYVNNLDLEVMVEGQTYYGNVFSGASAVLGASAVPGAYSAPGGSADFRNNVESVFLPAGVEGEFTLRIVATNLAGDGVPGNGDPIDQDFALVCYNCQGVPSFRLVATPSTQSVCQPDPAIFNIDADSYNGFSEPITLQAMGHPMGSIVTLAPNPVKVGNTSTLSITETGAAVPGAYQIVISGSGAGQIKSTFGDLSLHATVPASATLVSPAQEMRDILPQPVLQWRPVAGAELYIVEVATSTDFLDPIYTAASPATEYTVAAVLEPSTQYYWRVTARNACGAGAASVIRTFTTASQPTDVGYLPLILRAAP